MDTSKEYIKMCEKAVEIQNVKKEFPLPVGSYYTDGETLFCGTEISCVGLDYETEEFIWLPRQDQLQEMLIGKYSHFREVNYCFYEWSKSYKGQKHHEYLLTFNSMEQLWLAFVMKEKYGKIWNGEDWIK